MKNFLSDYLNIYFLDFLKTAGMDSCCNQGKVNVTDDEQTRRIKWVYV